MPSVEAIQSMYLAFWHSFVQYLIEFFPIYIINLKKMFIHLS
jgi:hypothetical protein